MPLSQLYPVPERILVLGPAGASKTTGWLNIAKFAHLTQSDAQFYVLNTDDSVPRMMTGYPQLQDRIHLSSGYVWTDYVAFGNMVAQVARPQDWVIIDFIGDAWADVTEHFVMQVFNQKIGDYFLFQRKSDEKTLEGWKDYGVINPMYKQWIKPIVFRSRFHVYCTAKAEALSGGNKPTESSEVRSLFLPYGVKPAGQKDLPFQFHSVLLAGKTSVPGQGTQYTLTTVKDRERKELKGLPVANFTMDYLVNVAGWVVG